MTIAGAERAAFPVIDVPAFIDRQPVGGFQLRLMLICAAVLFVDGFDTQAIGYVAPALAKEWHLARATLGPVFSAALFGLMIGALVFGTLADRLGRKRVIVVSTAVFGIGTLLTAFSPDVTWLIVLRFLTGLGLGGAMPNAVALTSEFSPHRRRASMVMAMFAGFSIGAALGGLVAAALIPAFGWRSVFVVGGICALLLVPLLVKSLPESIRYLTLAGGRDAAVHELLATMSPSAPPPREARFVVDEPRLAGLPVAHLFAEHRGLTTLLLWVVFFMSLLDLYLLSNWLPTVLHDLGVSIAAAAAIGAVLQIGGVIGTFSLGRLVDRFSFQALALTYLCAAVAVVAIGLSGHSAPLVTLAVFAAGFFIVGSQIASNALTATYYPTAIRSTGVGWALGIGRIGSIVGPLVGGYMLARHVDAKTLFEVAAIPALTAAAACFLLARTGTRA